MQPITSHFQIMTDLLTLRFEEGGRPGFFLRSKPGDVTIVYPPHTRFNTPQMQEWLQKAVLECLRKQARHILPARLTALAIRNGFTYNRVTIKNARTRWGSCSSRGNINLSLYLMLLPPHLIDYVLLHELCHTREMNHGPRFWTLLNSLTGGKALALRSELRNEAIRLQTG